VPFAGLVDPTALIMAERGPHGRAVDQGYLNLADDRVYRVVHYSDAPAPEE
jgi:hypothetical protein